MWSAPEQPEGGDFGESWHGCWFLLWVNLQSSRFIALPGTTVKGIPRTRAKQRVDSSPLHLRILHLMRWTPKDRATAYEQLQAINAGIEQIRLAFHYLKAISRFDRSELAQYDAFADEARAAALSYLAGVIEAEETERAGTLYRHRKVRER